MRLSQVVAICNNNLWLSGHSLVIFLYFLFSSLFLFLSQEIAIGKQGLCHDESMMIICFLPLWMNNDDFLLPVGIISQKREAWRTTWPTFWAGNREEVLPTYLLPTLGFITMVELVELCPPFGRGHLGWPPCQGPCRWGREGGLSPDRRDLGAMEEQDEGSIGRSLNLHFCREWKFL